MHGRLYLDIDRTWARLNIVNAGYMSFELIYNFVAARIVAYGPGLVPFMHEQPQPQGLYHRRRAGQFADQPMLVVHPCHARHRHAEGQCQARHRAGRGDRERAAAAANSTARPAAPTSATARQNPVFGLTVQKLELAHQGRTPRRSCSAANLRFRRGEWTFLKGDSGCGKTSLIKAINGLWPYGRGNIVFPEGVKSLLCRPGRQAAAGVAEAAGLPARLPSTTIPTRRSRRRCTRPASATSSSTWPTTAAKAKAWDQVLSGGQKQKLVVARILLQQPGLLFLDEATGALDPEARIAFHQAIKDNCPGITVISIMHEAEPPRSATGADSTTAF